MPKQQQHRRKSKTLHFFCIQSCVLTPTGLELGTGFPRPPLLPCAKHNLHHPHHVAIASRSLSISLDRCLTPQPANLFVPGCLNPWNRFPSLTQPPIHVASAASQTVASASVTPAAFACAPSTPRRLRLRSLYTLLVRLRSLYTFLLGLHSLHTFLLRLRSLY